MDKTISPSATAPGETVIQADNVLEQHAQANAGLYIFTALQDDVKG